MMELAFCIGGQVTGLAGWTMVHSCLIELQLEHLYIELLFLGSNVG